MGGGGGGFWMGPEGGGGRELCKWIGKMEDGVGQTLEVETGETNFRRERESGGFQNYQAKIKSIDFKFQ